MVATFRAETKLAIGDGQPGSDTNELADMIGSPLNELLNELDRLRQQLAISPKPSSSPPAASKPQPSPQPPTAPSQAEKRSPGRPRPVEPHGPSPYALHR
jgi:hypothetical protein